LWNAASQGDDDHADERGRAQVAGVDGEHVADEERGQVVRGRGLR